MGNCQRQQTVVENALVKHTGPVSQLKIYNYAWESAYQGLFDYESSKVKQSMILTKDTCVLEKQKQAMNLVSSAYQNQSQKVHCSSHKRRKVNCSKLQKNPITLKYSQFTWKCNNLWFTDSCGLLQEHYPIKQAINLIKKYVINEKDIIKFGKQKIKIKELVPCSLENHSAVIDLNQIKVSKEVYEDLRYREGLQNEDNFGMKKDLTSSPMLSNILSANEVQSVVTTSEMNCRICLQPGLQTDPLISPCKCTGSVRYIHLKCLRMWLGKRLNVSKHKFCITLNWQKLCCEMCQQPYKYRIYLDNKKFYTVQIPKPEKPYIVFQVMKKSNDKSSGKIYQFVSLSQKPQLSIGRKKDVDVRISDDISVSRHHASFSYDNINHKFILQDNRSKFGTLVLIKKNLCVRPNTRNIGFQIGAEVYRFQSFRGIVEAKSNKNQFNDDMEDYLNLQDSQDQQLADEQNSDDSEGRFEEPLEQEGELPMSPQHGSPVLRGSSLMIEGNVQMI